MIPYSLYIFLHFWVQLSVLPKILNLDHQILFLVQLLRKIKYFVGMIKRSILTFIALLALYPLIHPPSPPSSAPALDLNCGFTTHFQQFLTNNYASWGFDRPDLKCGAYGGKVNSTEKLTKVPIIFIHGNSDIAFGRGTQDGYLSWQTGFRDLATYLGSQGYTKSQLYTTTWGPANSSVAYQNNHAKKYVQRMRAFVEAVLAYTNASQVNVIGHSMGVSIGRKIIKGGSAQDEKEGVYTVGTNLTAKVKSFIGLAGANLGLSSCLGQFLLPTCSSIDGFDPGSTPTTGPSKFLSEINNSTIREGTNVYTIWSKYDDLIMNDCVVWGKVTSRIPQQTEEVIKNSKEWNHFYVRDQSGPDLIKWL